MRMIVATHNRKKLAELERILAPLGVEPVTGEDIGILLDEVEETGTTFEENAFLKADAACRQTGMPAVADDSGLMVDALDGRPGVYSARYAGEGASDADRIRKLLGEMETVPEKQRTARFASAVCCVFPDGSTVTARGECPGRIGREPQRGRGLRLRSGVFGGGWAKLCPAVRGGKGCGEPPGPCPAPVFSEAGNRAVRTKKGRFPC